MKQAWHLEGGVMTVGGDDADRGHQQCETLNMATLHDAVHYAGHQ